MKTLSVNEKWKVLIPIGYISSLGPIGICIATNERIKVSPPFDFLLICRVLVKFILNHYIFVIYVKIRTKSYIIRSGWFKFQKWQNFRPWGGAGG